MKITELQEGVEYYGIFFGLKCTLKYKVKNKELIFYNRDEYIWMVSNKSYNDIINAEFEPCEWTPKEDEKFYHPDFTGELVCEYRWDGCYYDLEVKRNVGVYRTKEEAIAKAKELGWT
jgi:hypothetical protein